MSPPPLTAKSPLDWNNNDIEDALGPWEARFRNLSPEAWLKVRSLAMRIAQENP